MPSKHAGQQFTMRFDADQKALLEQLALTYGGKKEAVLAGLRALERGAAEPTPEQALDVLARALAGARHAPPVSRRKAPSTRS